MHGCQSWADKVHQVQALSIEREKSESVFLLILERNLPQRLVPFSVVAKLGQLGDKNRPQSKWVGPLDSQFWPGQKPGQKAASNGQKTWNNKDLIHIYFLSPSTKIVVDVPWVLFGSRDSGTANDHVVHVSRILAQKQTKISVSAQHCFSHFLLQQRAIHPGFGPNRSMQPLTETTLMEADDLDQTLVPWADQSRCQAGERDPIHGLSGSLLGLRKVINVVTNKPAFIIYQSTFQAWPTWPALKDLLGSNDRLGSAHAWQRGIWQQRRDCWLCQRLVSQSVRKAGIWLIKHEAASLIAKATTIP